MDYITVTKQNQFPRHFDLRNWNDGQCPKHQSQKHIIIHDHRELSLVFGKYPLRVSAGAPGFLPKVFRGSSRIAENHWKILRTLSTMSFPVHHLQAC